MGRPPIGKRAMSGSERQRRYLDRLLQTAQGDDALKSELAAAKVRIQKLTSELAAAKAPGDGSATLMAELAAARARIQELESELREAAPRDNKNDQIAELEAKVRALTEIASHFAQQGQKGPPVRFTEGEYRLIVGRLHPDRVLDPEESKKYDRAFKLFTERLPKEFFAVKPPPARPEPPPLPRTPEEMMAARLRVRAENRARAKRAAATRAAKRAPRRSIKEGE
jgi:hypothetical protein